MTLAGFSPYLGSLLVQNPEFLEAIPPGGLPRGPRTREDLEEDLARLVQLNAGHDPSIVLRRFKKREILRIALADILAVPDLPGIPRALSVTSDGFADRTARMRRMPL